LYKLQNQFFNKWIAHKNSTYEEDMPTDKKSRAEIAGIMLADAAMEVAHLTYNAPRGTKMITACIARLQERIGEIQSKEADPKYKEARYGKRKLKNKL
jgi:hypothetical protein